MTRVWPGLVVEDNTVQVHISAIRKALGADRGMLKTISGRGYRLLGRWTTRQEALPVPRASAERARLCGASVPDQCARGRLGAGRPGSRGPAVA